jgi:hypothetical protein
VTVTFLCPHLVQIADQPEPTQRIISAEGRDEQRKIHLAVVATTFSLAVQIEQRLSAKQVSERANVLALAIAGMLSQGGAEGKTPKP